MSHSAKLGQAFQYFWAFPATILGLPFLALAHFSGGRSAVVQGALEIQGGWVATFLQRGLLMRAASALTLGHVILGCDQACLDRTRQHEHVHVRQYERWGPFFIPAYLLCGVVLYFRGRDPYLDNPFEREAFEQAPD